MHDGNKSRSPAWWLFYSTGIKEGERERQAERGSEGGEEVESERSPGQRHVWRERMGEGWGENRQGVVGGEGEERGVGESEVVQSEAIECLSE